MPSIYRFGRLAPVRAPRAHRNAPLLGPATLGIEVTEPELSRRCGLGNLDPQHGDADGGEAAIAAAIHWPLPRAGSMLVTLRPDADSIGAMAVLELRAGHLFDQVARPRLELIARCDGFQHGSWARWRARNPVLPLKAGLKDFHGPPLAYRALGQGIRSCGEDLDAAVDLVARWLVTGKLPRAHYLAAAKMQRTLVKAWNCGEISVERLAASLVAVRSTRVDTLTIGYRYAPVVVAQGCYDGLRRITIAQFSPDWIDLASVKRALYRLEPGWGGSATIIGSPQGAPSRLTLPTILASVERHRRR